MDSSGSSAGLREQVENLRAELSQADAVLVGAGAGLSTAAGLSYTGERFKRNFAQFEQAYGFHDMYTAGFYLYPDLESYWGYWSRHVMVNRYEPGALPAYRQLRSALQGREFFVLTTNVDHQFQKAGFPRERLFYTQGDYGLFQCSGPCMAETYGNEEAVRAMAAQQRELRIPAELVPRCPRCGRPMAMNLRVDAGFVEDEGWHRAQARYSSFASAHREGRVLFLELGVGFNSPGVIKYPFWQMAAANPQARFACVNLGEAWVPEPLRGRSLAISADLAQVIELLAEEAGR